MVLISKYPKGEAKIEINKYGSSPQFVGECNEP